ncbi:DNA-binding protein [Hymenobacter busanensis]|uniref:DNA-binding protein n=1 Tax=Hymenobacter busanensis TaxID=2607656 RepID=A0A7L4ZYT0_9BACT|nr:DNA-binding protein [Hymenobacter busanensis]KAA9333230.1 DNA-binding protein [Hymenobacter busanensis]QHJ08093.1 DNA-binding protein [Hymenobacter busanensis]
MSIAPDELRTLGNPTLLQRPKTAFFCSREYPLSAERPTFLWAMEQRYRNRCVLSGFHSRLEQTVFRYLLQGEQQPIVYVLGRGIQPNLRLEYGPEIADNRLLFVTPFEPDVRSITQETADIRNLLIAELAEAFFVPYAAPGGNLEQLLLSEAVRGKPVFTLDLPENQVLLAQGARVWHSGVLGNARGAGT